MILNVTKDYHVDSGKIGKWHVTTGYWDGSNNQFNYKQRLSREVVEWCKEHGVQQPTIVEEDKKVLLHFASDADATAFHLAFYRPSGTAMIKFL